MIRFTYKKTGIQIEQQWFTDNKIYDCEPGTRILIVHGVNKDNAQKGYYEDQSTLYTDLTLSEEEIYGSFRKNTRYEIRRADKEGLTYFSCRGSEITDELIDDFEKVFIGMYESKGIKKGINRELIRSCIARDCFMITGCRNDSETLVYHTYLFDELNARLYQSCSLFREDSEEDAKVVGFANRGLHWYDLRYFRDKGLERYDWGGISSMEKPNGIDKFKMGFGGKQHLYYNLTVHKDIIGRGVLFARRCLTK